MPVNQYPFLQPAFLDALEQCGAVSPDTGWRPCPLTVEQAWVPLYARSHSRGEYVFDFSWAEAYERHGLDYYPKLITAVPFTPAVGPRWRGELDVMALWRQIEQRLHEQQASGWHVLFPDDASRESLAELPLVSRQACHFRWFNRDYVDFDDFLSRFQSRKRKNLRKERRRVSQQGVTVSRRHGDEISAADWAFFYRCYASTYLKRGQLPYLNEDFFIAINQRLNSQVMMVLASRGEEPVAAALYFHDKQCLYGRYWGCIEELDALHFELCYYQGIEFAIEQGFREFDPGVQGEHKILRGFEPVITWSMHHLREPAFQRAIAEFCEQEAEHVRRYQAQARTLLPFHKGD